MIFDQRNAELFVFTFKEGVLSAMAHDLRLRVDRFRIELRDDGSVEATFDPTSLRVVCARKDGADAPHALPHLLFSEVERNIEKDVLQPKRHPQIRFVAHASNDQGGTGALTLHGVTRDVTVRRSVEKDAHGVEVVVGRARLDQRDFSIKPFSAALGTLKVKPHIDIEVRARVAASVAPATTPR